MPLISRKTQIYIGLTVLVVTTLIMFLFVFPKIEQGNLSKVGQVLNKSKQYQDLLQQQASFEAGKSDLEALAKKPYQPSDFFSKDTSLVSEIETLEDLAKQEKLEMDFAVTGTKASAGKAPTVSSIVQIPYTLSLTGSLSSIHSFLQRFENLKFVTHAQGFEIASVNEGKVKANISAVFFIQK